MFHVVQVVRGFKILQTLNYYFKLSSWNIIPCSHVICSSGLSLVSLFGKIATQTCVSVGNFLVATSPAVIVRRRVETELATLFKSFLLDQSLEFPQLL
jgi:hypothetical protein